MKRSKRLLLLLLVMTLSLSMVLSGCGNKKDPAPGPETEGTEETGGEEEGSETTESTGPKVLRLSGMPATTFNPHTYQSSEDGELISYISGNLLALIYDKDSDGIKFIGDHAEDVPTTEDNIVWQFKIRDDVKWEDGDPITAETYEYSYKRLLDPKLANRNAMSLFDTLAVKGAQEFFNGELEDWEQVGIRALDGNILEIELENEMPEIDILTAFAGGGGTSPVKESLYEEGMAADGSETTYATELAKIPSSGAYKLTEWVRDQHRVFEKVEGTPMAEIYVPDRIESRVISQSSTRLQLFENGELDTATVSGTDYDKYAEDPRVVFQERNTVWGFFVNSDSEKNPILQNNDLRKALFYGIDRDMISKGVFKVYESTPYFISSIPMVDYTKGLKYADTPEAKAIRPEGNGYEPEKAKEFFEKAYEANGNKKIEIEIVYFEEQETMKRMTEVAEEQYENLFGSDKLDIKLRAMPPMAAYDAYRDGDYEMGIGAYTQSAFNPWSSMFVWHTDFPQKSHRFSNKDFDELYERTTKGDLMMKPEERTKALADMESMLIDFVPQVPIFQNNNAQVFSERINLITGGKFIPGVGFATLQCDIVDPQ